jgi:hypothetical protein
MFLAGAWLAGHRQRPEFLSVVTREKIVDFINLHFVSL